MTNNAVRYDAENGTVTITVIRRNGKQYDVLMDAWFYAWFPSITLHVKPTRVGRDEYYAATYLDGKLVYLHQLVGEAYLLGAKAMKDFDRNTIDHRNRNSLDCRVRNLRAANRKEQRANQRRGQAA